MSSTVEELRAEWQELKTSSAEAKPQIVGLSEKSAASKTPQPPSARTLLIELNNPIDRDLLLRSAPKLNNRKKLNLELREPLSDDQ